MRINGRKEKDLKNKTTKSDHREKKETKTTKIV